MLLDSGIHRIIFQNVVPTPGKSPEALRFGLPGRGVALVRPGLDVVVLPGGSEGLEEFWRHWCRRHGTRHWQAVFTRAEEGGGGGLYLEDGFGSGEMEAVKEALARAGADESKEGSDCILVPCAYRSSCLHDALREKFFPALPQLRVQKVGMADEGGTPAHKGVFHEIPALVKNGYATRQHLCYDFDEAAEAVDSLGAEGVQRFVFKPVLSSGGVGIEFFQSKPELRDIVQRCSIPGGFVIEEFLDIDTWGQDRQEASFTLEFFERELIGGVTIQLMEGLKGVGYMTWHPFGKEFNAHCRKIGQIVYDHLRPEGAWGMDVLSVGGRPLAVDLNCGRLPDPFYSKLHHIESKVGEESQKEFPVLVSCFGPHNLTLQDALRLATSMSDDGRRRRASVFFHCEGVSAVYEFEAGTAEEALEMKTEFEEECLKLAQ